MTRFKVFSADSAAELEKALNEWAAALPAGTKVRRTQLACSQVSSSVPLPMPFTTFGGVPAGSSVVFAALVNYEEAPPS